MKKQISGFKGLLRNVDQAQLPNEYGTVCTNLNVDEPIGQLSLRKGYAPWGSKDDFTNLLTAFEYTIEDDSGAVITLVNDNGKFEYFKNGAYVEALTPPTGATIDVTTYNSYFGWRNAIRITTGTGATNYILWFGYTSRDETNNDGLFGDAIGDSGTGVYRFLRSQLINTNGVFSIRTSSIVYLDSYYYISLVDSRWIEKRDSNFQLVDMWAVNEDENVSADDNSRVSLATDGTYLYAGTSGGMYQINPYTHKCTAYITQANILDVCTDGTDIYFIDATEVYKHAISGFTLNDTADADSTAGTGFTAATKITCDDTATTGIFYVADLTTIRQRGKNDIAADDDTYALGTIDAGISAVIALQWKDADQVFVSCYDAGDGNSYIVDLDASGVSTKNAHYQDDNLRIVSFPLVGGTTIRAVDGYFGILKNVDSATFINPEFTSLSIVSSGTGSLAAGSYFYKICVEDVDGQVYTLSDPILFNSVAGSSQLNLRVSATGDRSESNKFGEFYRIKYVHIFRAFNSDTDAGEPSSDYNFLKTIDINDSGWDYNSDYEIYYFNYTDNTVQSSISPTTYLETSGISPNTKPRHVNGKYWTWLNDQIHLASIYNDGDSFPSRIVVSPVNAPDSIAFYDTYDFHDGVGSSITGISSFYNRTVVFKQFSMGIYVDGDLEDSLEIGLAAARGLVKHNNEIYFLNDSGLYRMTNNTPVKISDPVRDLLGAASASQVFYADEFDRVIVQNSSVCLVYSVPTNTWVKYQWATFADFYKNSDGNFIGAASSELMTLFTGTDDDGTAIDVEFESGLINLSEIGEDEEFYEVILRLALTLTGSGTNTFVIYDADKTSLKSETLTATSSTYPITKNIYMQSVWAESFSWEIRAQATVFLLSGIMAKYATAGEAVNEI